MNNEHIHVPDDGRGFRDVWVDGKKIDCAYFVDTKRGIVDAYRQPYEIHKHGKRLLTRRFRGHVVVKQKC